MPPTSLPPHPLQAQHFRKVRLRDRRGPGAGLHHGCCRPELVIDQGVDEEAARQAVLQAARGVDALVLKGEVGPGGVRVLPCASWW